MNSLLYIPIYILIPGIYSRAKEHFCRQARYHVAPYTQKLCFFVSGS